jgi:hypothetical protein
VTPHDLAALTAAGYHTHNVLDAALNAASREDCMLWLTASRHHMLWDARCGITVERCA